MKRFQTTFTSIMIMTFVFVVGCFPVAQSVEGDLDVDGIPDNLEAPGETYLGMPVYEWGARPDQTDLFVEIDYMDPTDGGVVPADEGLIPREEALQKVVDAFAVQGIALHFDVGDLFDRSLDANDNPARFDLGGGEEVPYADSIGLGVTDTQSHARTDYSARYMDEDRHSLFYYMLFGSTQNTDGSPGSGGAGEIANRISLVTLGGWGLNSLTPLEKNLLVNMQASTIMHEFGHNLGLRHGGHEDTNFKPNYTSVMNYLYAIEGLPNLETSDEGDRYYLLIQSNATDAYAADCFGNHPYWPDTLSNSPFAEAFFIDYSHGLNQEIDESQVEESAGIGANNGYGVDFDCDAWVETLTDFDLNRDGDIGKLNDHNDWENLFFYFHYNWGVSPIDQLLTSIEISEEPPPPAWVTDKSLRQR